MGWFSKKKEEVKQEHKSASFLFGSNMLRVMQQDFSTLAGEGYGANPIVRACINKIAIALTSVDIKAYIQDKNGNLTEKPNHPLLKLLEKPNPTMSGDDLFIELVSSLLISGNSYLHGTGIDQVSPKPPKELYVFSPAYMKVIGSDGFIPTAYEYKTTKGSTLYPVNQLTGISAIMHKKLYNPLDKWYGLSPMTAAAFGIDTINEGARWNLRLLQNEGRPSGALVMKGADGKPATLTDAQYLKLREEIEQQFTGSNNAGKPLLLEGGLEWQEMSVNAKDMDFERNINNAKRDIALVYGVPPMLLGIQGDATYSNMAEARLAFWTDTILPLLQSVLESINNWLAPMYGDGVILWYDEDMIPALEPLRAMKAQRIEASNTMTINEKRNAMGIDDFVGGDELFVDSNKIPLSLASDMSLNNPNVSVSI